MNELIEENQLISKEKGNFVWINTKTQNLSCWLICQSYTHTNWFQWW
jgi:hypothetical protein